nr:McrC family protein [Motilibacter aurantiacus]
MSQLRLREWAPAPALALPAPVIRLLRHTFRARVEPSTTVPGTFDVLPGSRVGVAAAAEWQVSIEPKLPVPRVLFLAAYASAPPGWQQDTGLEHEEDLLEGAAALFAGRAHHAVNAGLLHGYHTVDDDLTTIRGRVNLAGQLRRRPGIDLPIAVRYQGFDENVLENQLLLAATHLLGKLPIRSAGTRRSLYRLLGAFELTSHIWFPPNAVPHVTWTRLNAHYRPAVELARMLLGAAAPELRGGDGAGAALVLDMNRVFESFVRAALRDALGLTEQQFPAPGRATPLWLDRARQVPLNPDLSWWEGARCRWVGDVKYKQDTGAGASSDLYQLLAYITAAGLRSGWLIYADGAPRRVHELPGAQASLTVDRLDTALPPAELLAQIAALASRIKASTSTTAELRPAAR